MLKFQSSVTKPAEIMNSYYQNQSCDPFTQASQSCELGNFAVYSLNVTGAHDVVAGLEFARQNKVRLSIRNTGHEYAAISRLGIERKAC